MSSILIRDGYVVTPKGNGIQVIEDGAVAIADGKIVAVGKTDKLAHKHSNGTVINAARHAILPGFIDAHFHSSLSLLRGMAQDVPEKEWMHGAVDPFSKHYNPETAIAGTKLSILEGIRAGTTCFCDYGSNMREVAERVYEKVGVRANLCSTINEMGSQKRKADELYIFDQDVGEQKLTNALRLIQDWNGSAEGRITCHFGPQAADMMSKEMLLHIKELAKEHRLPIHMHIAQGGRERSQMTKRYGKSTVSFLNELGFLDKRLVAVHCHDATDDELKVLAKTKARMVGCPGSIGLIDGVAPPLHAYVKAGGIAALGSDQCPPAGHNMLAQMRYAAILNKVRHMDPTVLPAWMVFRMATIEAAKCHGLDRLIGSIEVGKRADIILIDLNRPNLTPILSKPLRNLIPNIVYHATGDEVITSIVDGHIIMDNRKVQVLDEVKVLSEAQVAANRLAENGDRDFFESSSYLSRMMKDGLL